MTFQRIVCLALLAASAIVFIYSLGLMTDLYDGVYKTYRNGKTSIAGADIYMNMQEFNRHLTVASIGLILVSLFNFAMGTSSRRKYYIGNYISVGLSTICSVGVSVWAFSEIMSFRDYYVNKIDWKALKEFLERRSNAIYTESTFWFDVSYIVFGLLLLCTALLIVNLVLKIMVMNSEKRLIGSRKDVRA